MSRSEFSFAGTGFVSRLSARTGLSGQDPARLVRGAILLGFASWLILLLLSLASGHALPDSVARPFLTDLRVDGRLLVAVPLLLIADLIVSRRLAAVIRHFLEAGLLPDASREALEAAVGRLERRRDSSLAEALLLALAFAASVASVVTQAGNAAASWIAVGGTLTPAGWCYGLAALPLFQFLVLRWIWRGAIWAVFLRGVSRLDLELSAAHPDHAGGLGFVGRGQTAFCIVVAALSAVLSCAAGERYLREGASVLQYKSAFGGFIVLCLAAVLAPLLVFGKPLARLKDAALLNYGGLAASHQRAFESKWLAGRPPDGQILGSPDVSSLADLAASYELVLRMRPIPIDVATVVAVLLAAVLPLLPAVATAVPLKDMLGKLLKIVA
jgi:hypothetical protein